MPLTKLNNKAVANVTTLPVALGDMVLVSSATASSSASIEFSLGSYKEYQFYFVNIHGSSDGGSWFNVNFSTDGGSNYNVTKTTTFFFAYQTESGTSPTLQYEASYDLAQSTAYQRLGEPIGADNDQNLGGILKLYNPSSTTYVKHFMYSGSQTSDADYMENCYVAGYANTTSALTNIRFQMTSGNIDAGKILMFGVN